MREFISLSTIAYAIITFNVTLIAVVAVVALVLYLRDQAAKKAITKIDETEKNKTL